MKYQMDYVKMTVEERILHLEVGLLMLEPDCPLLEGIDTQETRMIRRLAAFLDQLPILQENTFSDFKMGILNASGFFRSGKFPSSSLGRVYEKVAEIAARLHHYNPQTYANAVIGCRKAAASIGEADDLVPPPSDN